MTITNNGKTPDKVSCVSSDASAECQIHTMTMNNGVMMMRPVEGGLEIKPGETVTLKPSGLHVMLVNLKHPLEQGKTVKATLKFDTAGTIDVDYPIAAIGAAAPGVPAGGGTMMMQGGGGCRRTSRKTAIVSRAQRSTISAFTRVLRALCGALQTRDRHKLRASERSRISGAPFHAAPHPGYALRAICLP